MELKIQVQNMFVCHKKKKRNWKTLSCIPAYTFQANDKSSIAIRRTAKFHRSLNADAFLRYSEAHIQSFCTVLFVPLTPPHFSSTLILAVRLQKSNRRTLLLLQMATV